MQNDIKKAKETLFDGGIICYPTDTIWGIGCDATNAEAVENLYKIKHRPPSKSMLILLDNLGKIPSYIKKVPDIAYDLIEVSSDPITIIFSGVKGIASNLIAKDDSIGIRIVDKHPWCTKLLQQFKKPIVSTSANFSGEKSPDFFYDINQDLLNLCNYVAEYDRDSTINNKSSSIIKLDSSGHIQIIRK